MTLRAALPFSEHQLQISVCELLDIGLRPGLYYLAIPNGGARHIAVARKLKSEGVKAGVPDLQILLEEGRTAWLELKVKGGSLSPDQRLFRDVARKLGHPWAMAKTLDEASSFLREIGALRNDIIISKKVFQEDD
jgi:VRR-NUC domain